MTTPTQTAMFSVVLELFGDEKHYSRKEMKRRALEALAAFRGAKLEGVWSLWDALACEWYDDWATVLETDEGCISVDALSGIKLGVWFDDIDFAAPVSFFEEECGLYALFDLSWKKREELSFLEGRQLDAFWARCDKGLRPFALDISLGDEILSIGGPWDETAPKVLKEDEPWDERFVENRVLLS